VNDSPKWTRDKEKARRFQTKELAEAHANVSGLYTLLFEEV
jgi:hypothetical protein